MTPSFSNRLAVVLAQGNLTVSDLARWFERPRPTVAGWVRGGEIGRELAPLDAAYVSAQLAALEKRLKKREGLPVPRMAVSQRRTYLEGLKNGAGEATARR